MEADGRTSFQALQNALTTDHTAKLHYFVFDLPYLNGYDLRHVPLVERKRCSSRVLENAPATLKLQRPHRGLGRGVLQAGVQAQARRHDLQARAVDLPVGGRSRDWLKVKCSMRQEMVIGGYTDPEGTRSGFGALLLGVYEPDGNAALFGQSRDRFQRSDAEDRCTSG